MTLRLLVFGGRDYPNQERVFAVLDALDRLLPLTIIEGGCRRGEDKSADYFAFLWATARGRVCHTEEAQWGLFGGSAGPIRNQRMIDKYRPHLGLGFPGGNGTADMAARLEAAHTPTIRSMT